jgi:Zn-dependent alcohol dehydrogenase
MPSEPAEWWSSVLADLNARVEREVRLHCCGGFVVSAVYGLARTTADLDVLAVVPSDQQRELARLAGRGSVLHQTNDEARRGDLDKRGGDECNEQRLR